MSDSCDPMDCSLPGSSVCGILQARVLEWVVISFSRGSSRPRDQTHISCISCIAGGYFLPLPRQMSPWEEEHTPLVLAQRESPSPVTHPPGDIASGKMLAINGCPCSEWKLISPSEQRRKRKCVKKKEGFPGYSAVKHLSANAGGAGLIPDPGRSTGEGNGNPLQYPCLGNPMHRGAWRATVHGVAKSWMRLSTHAKKKGGSKAS